MTALDDAIRAVVEAASGSRKLDVRIAAAIDTEVGSWPESDIQIALEGPHTVQVPAYTTSLDAALTLVPEGRSISVHIYGPEAAGALRIDGDTLYLKQRAPLALCLAALRTLPGEGAENG